MGMMRLFIILATSLLVAAQVIECGSTARVIDLKNINTLKDEETATLEVQTLENAKFVVGKTLWLARKCVRKSILDDTYKYVPKCDTSGDWLEVKITKAPKKVWKSTGASTSGKIIYRELTGCFLEGKTCSETIKIRIYATLGRDNYPQHAEVIHRKLRGVREKKSSGWSNLWR